MISRAAKAAPKKEAPDTKGRRAENKSDNVKDKIGAAKKEAPFVERNILEWPAGELNQRALKRQWFALAGRMLTGGALKGAVIVNEEFMVKSRAMHRNDAFLAHHYGGCSERTIERCFAALKESGFAEFRTIHVTIDGKVRTTGRQVTLCLPTALLDEFQSTVAPPSVGPSTDSGEQRQDSESTDKSRTPPTAGGATNLGKNNPGKSDLGNGDSGKIAQREGGFAGSNDINIEEIIRSLDDAMESMPDESKIKDESHRLNLLRTKIAPSLGIDRTDPTWAMLPEIIKEALSRRREASQARNAELDAKIEKARQEAALTAEILIARFKDDLPAAMKPFERSSVEQWDRSTFDSRLRRECFCAFENYFETWGRQFNDLPWDIWLRPKRPRWADLSSADKHSIFRIAEAVNNDIILEFYF